MRVTFIIDSLRMGGAERLMSIMTSYWATHGHTITLITMEGHQNDFFTVDEKVNRLTVDDLVAPSPSVWIALKHNWQRIWRLRQLIRDSKPDVVITFMERMNVLGLLASIGLNIPIIISEHTDPRQSITGRSWAFARRLLYRRGSALMVMTESVRQWALDYISPRRIAVISHPVTIQPIISPTSKDKLLIMALGRMIPLKGFDLLLRAFAQCVEDFPAWSLQIIGDGPERANLVQLATDLDIIERIEMPGSVQNPAPFFNQASLFVMPSLYEGFGLVLIEAMACGLPVISFDCPSGPSEIIRHEIDGLLVPPEDVDALATAMRRLMADEQERKRLAIRAIEVNERFNVDTIMNTWEQLCLRVIKQQS